MDDGVGSPEELLANVTGGMDSVALSRASEVNAGERTGSVYMFV